MTEPTKPEPTKPEPTKPEPTGPEPPKPEARKPEPPQAPAADLAGTDPRSKPRPKEIGGPKGPEPTRYGDWEKGGRCIDF